MAKIKISHRLATTLDYSLWAIAVVFAFWADWRAGVALLAFDAMRVFEDLGRLTVRLRINNLIVRVEVVDVVSEDNPEKKGTL